MARERKNTFSWSVSRDAVFRECPRKYYYNHYGFWGGWRKDADQYTRETYVLKQLKTRAVWIGQVVHECVARSLQNLSRGVPLLELDEILSITRSRMRQDFRQSRSGMYRLDPKVHCGLFEHEYEEDVTDEEWKETADTVDACLRTFYESDQFRSLRDMDPKSFLEVEQLSSFYLDGLQVWIKMDCATREGDRIAVWDWKTGRREGDPGLTVQMACYAYYARQAFRVELENVETRRFDLYRGTLRTQRVSDRELDENLAYIGGSIKDMLGMLEDAKANIAIEERFRKVEQPNICFRCNFLKICKPSL